MKSYSQLIVSDSNGLTVWQLIEALKQMPSTALICTDSGAIACKVSKTFVENHGDLQTFIEIYTEKL